MVTCLCVFVCVCVGIWDCADISILYINMVQLILANKLAESATVKMDFVWNWSN